MENKVVKKRIDKIVKAIELERKKPVEIFEGEENSFKNGLDCGAQLATDLLEEWEKELDEGLGKAKKKEREDCTYYDPERGQADIDCPFVRKGSFDRCPDCPED